MAQKKLASYQAKRDFTKTPEPVPPSKYPRFVIQKHAANLTALRFSGLSTMVSSSPGLSPGLPPVTA